MVSATYIIALVGLLASSATSAHAHKHPSYLGARTAENGIYKRAETIAGCFEGKEGHVFEFFDPYMASGICAPACIAKKKASMLISGTDCFCGELLPRKKDKAEDSMCTTKCPGFGEVMCGGGIDEYYTAWRTGLKSNVKHIGQEEEEAASSSKSSSSAAAAATKTSEDSAPPAVVTVGGETIIVTPSSDADDGKKDSGPNKAGIAAGVVVGVVVLAAAAGGFWFYLRTKRRNEVEEEYKRQAAIKAFVSPASETSTYDARLDPAVMRRMSDGSIADNQDYSRRILKVTNA